MGVPLNTAQVVPQSPSAGVTLNSAGGSGFLDGIGSFLGMAANRWLDREFPEQTEYQAADDAVRDTAVVEATGAQPKASGIPTQYLVYGGIALGGFVLLALLLRK